MAQLLEQLQRVDGIEWIRLMYVYPMYMSDALIDLIAHSDRILPYIDMPLQHINDALLRRIARRVDRRQTEQLLATLRQRVKNLVLRTTMITGFPGETDEQFDELVQFVGQQRFERLGVFTYSRETDTPAAALPGHLPDEIKNERRDRLMAVQQRIAFQWNQDQVGRRMDVLIDQPVADQPDAWVGRSYADAPDVDGVVYVTGADLAAGQIVPCEIVATSNYDLVAAAVELGR